MFRNWICTHKYFVEIWRSINGLSLLRPKAKSWKCRSYNGFITFTLSWRQSFPTLSPLLDVSFILFFYCGDWKGAGKKIQKPLIDIILSKIYFVFVSTSLALDCNIFILGWIILYTRAVRKKRELLQQKAHVTLYGIYLHQLLNKKYAQYDN